MDGAIRALRLHKATIVTFGYRSPLSHGEFAWCFVIPAESERRCAAETGVPGNAGPGDQSAARSKGPLRRAFGRRHCAREEAGPRRGVQFMKRSLLVFVALAGVAAPALAQCSSTQTKSECAPTKPAHEVVTAAYHQSKDIVETAIGAGNFTTLAKALDAAGLVDTLKGKGPFTVFAPTDEAFAKLGTATIESLLKPENKHKLAAILKYHVLSGEVLAKDVKTGAAVTVNGQRVDLKVDGKQVTVDQAKVTATDVLASNGVIHVIDTVILPSEKTVVQTAIDNGNFKTLAKLIEAAGLKDTLSGEGPFTVFAPTDAAFEKLGKATLDDLAKPENKQKLADILKYHVVSGRVFSDQALKAGKAKTLQGGEVTIKTEGGKASVDAATLTTTDLDASNGVIHVIDSVILPK